MIDLPKQIGSLTPAKRKLLERLLSSDKNSSAPIAVVGMACRFPGANNLDEFWDLIREGRNQSRVVPRSRWDVESLYDPAADVPGRMATKWACMIDEVDHFDPVFFGITPREASRMDPQQRLLLHNCWEAMEHAGIDPAELSRTPTGIFVGVGQNDYSRVMAQYDNSLYHLDAHCGTGGALSICANRLSYVFNFNGPSVAIDTACSSALVAVHAAMTSLRRGECNAALAGGVNVCLTPETFISLSKARMLSPTGACRPFDSRANGYVRGEGCGVVVLKRLSDAIDDGDRVLSILRGSAVNHSGRTSGITAPNGLAQQRVIRDALSDGGVQPDQIEYIEAHGTGTPLGDPIEVEALSSVFGKRAGMDRSVYLTSVKANIGHTEIAAGIAGLIKTVLVMKNGLIAPQIELDELNPHLQFDHSRIKIPREPVQWRSDQPRFAGVSSFGFGGTNSHVVLESVAAPKSDPATNRSNDPLSIRCSNTNGNGSSSSNSTASTAPIVLTVSAKTKRALADLASKYHDVLSGLSFDKAYDFCQSANLGRTHFDHRAAIVAEDSEQLQQALSRLAEKRRSAQLKQGQRQGSGALKIAGMFTGQGSQYENMGMGLYQSQPVFRAQIDRCDAIVREFRGKSLLAVLKGDDESESVNQTYWTQPALFAVEYALAKLWESWGVRPDYMIGHSVGEYVAATLADVFSLETGLKLICRRAELMQSLPPGGAMAVLFMDGATLKPSLEPYADSVSIAAFNGPANTTISGTSVMVQRVVRESEKAGVTSQMLEVSHAFHSPLMEPILDEFEQFAEQFEFNAPSIPIVSNLTGKLETDAVFDAQYWRDHIRNPVCFAQGVDQLADSGVNCMIEMGPTATLISMARRCRADWKPIALPSLKKSADDRRFTLESAADLYANGFDVDWNAVHNGRAHQFVDVPTYPMDMKPYWFRPDHATTYFRDFLFSTSHASPLLGTKTSNPTMCVFENRLTSYMPKFVADHRVKEDIVLPAAAYVDMAVTAARNVFDDDAVSVESMSIAKAMFVTDAPRMVHTIVTGDSLERRKIQVFSRLADAEDDVPWDLNASGFIAACAGDLPKRVDFEEVKSRHMLMLDREDFYQTVAERGLDYGPAFQVIQNLWRCDSEVVCDVSANADVVAEQDQYSLHAAIGDGCMQAMTGAIPLEVDGSFCPDLYLPIAIGRVTVFGEIDGPIRYYVHRTSEHSGPSPDSVEADVYILNEAGEVLVAWEQVRVQRISQASRDEQSDPHQWLYDVTWKELSEAGQEDQSQDRQPTQAEAALGACLVLGDATGFSDALISQIASSDQSGAGYVDSISTGRWVPKEQTAGATTKHFALTHDIGENFRPLLKEWAADVPDDSPVNIVLCRTLDARLPVDGSLSEINEAETALTEVFRFLAELMWAKFPGRVAVWLVSQGARAVLDQDNVNPNQSPLVGLGQVASQELRQLNVRMVDLDPSLDSKDQVSDLIFQMQHHGSEPAIAVRDSKWFAPRLSMHKSESQERFVATVPTDSAYRLRLGDEDTIDSLRFEKVHRQAPKANEVEVEVRAAGLNFSDVLKSMGLYPGITDDVVPLGLECAGIVSAVGPGVDAFQIGDEVMGIVPYGFASHCITSDFALTKKPKTLDFEEAAAIPLAFLTAYYCLREVARLQPGERVLIHAGAGGVGLAAIQIAQELDAEIFATAGSDEKRDFLKAIGVHHVMNSRTLEFADQIQEITNGEGVDVVLNSLPGDAIDKSLQSLAAYGRFVEIGKTDIYSNKPMGLSPFQDNLSYCAVDLDRLFRQRPQVASNLMKEIIKRFESEVYQPLNLTQFPIENVVGAFRFMSQRKNIGKIVTTIDPLENAPEVEIRDSESDETGRVSSIRSDASYLVTGGLGSLGLATAKWLVEGGAGGVVLMSRRAPDDATLKYLEELSNGETKVCAVRGDVCDADSLRNVLESISDSMPPLKGVLHAAGVLRDRLMNQMSDEDFRFPLAPKTIGTWNLHSVTKDANLDFMVLFSSVSSVLGTAGQSNYGAANAFMDGFAEYRRSLGLPTVSINWGAFSGSGMAADLAETMESQGVNLLPVDASLSLMDDAIASGQSRVTVFRADWSRFGGLLKSMMSGELEYALIEDLYVETESSDSGGDLAAQELKDELQSLDSQKMRERLQAFFAEQLSEIMGIDPEDIDQHATLTSLGMDSLMAMELGKKMQKSLGIELPMSVYLEGPTIDKLASFVCGVLGKDEKSDAETNEDGTSVDDSASPDEQRAVSR